MRKLEYDVARGNTGQEAGRWFRTWKPHHSSKRLLGKVTAPFSGLKDEILGFQVGFQMLGKSRHEG